MHILVKGATLWNELAPSPTLAPDITGQSDQSNPLCFIAILLVVAPLIYLSVRADKRSKQRFSEARVRDTNMTDKENFDLERKILSCLHRSHRPDLTTSELSTEIGVQYEDTCIATHRLIERDLVELVEQEAQTKTPGPAKDSHRQPQARDALRITHSGLLYFRALNKVEGISVNGDVISAGGSVNNRSSITNSFNGYGARYDTAIQQAIATLQEAVAATGNEQAQDWFEAFSDEMNSENPRPHMIKRFLESALETVPKVAAITVAVDQIYRAIS